MTQQETTNKSPTHTVYAVREIDGKKDWQKVGAAWQHADGEGLNQLLNVFGDDILLTIRRNKDKN